MEALLINRDDIVKLTGLGGNVDTTKILPHVKTAQDIHLQPIIGTKLLDKIKELITAGTLSNAANAKYKTLVDTYITPTLVFFTMADFLPFLQFEISNGGVARNQAENGISSDKSETDALVHKFKDKASFYGTRLLSFICDNNDNYPEYSTNEGSDISGGSETDFFGWVL